VVSSLFSIKAAHCGNAIEFAMNGEGKRQREAPEIRGQKSEVEVREQKSKQGAGSGKSWEVEAQPIARRRRWVA
jgi:hypothetical protein